MVATSGMVPDGDGVFIRDCATVFDGRSAESPDISPKIGPVIEELSKSVTPGFVEIENASLPILDKEGSNEKLECTDRGGSKTAKDQGDGNEIDLVFERIESNTFKTDVRSSKRSIAIGEGISAAGLVSPEPVSSPPLSIKRQRTISSSLVDPQVTFRESYSRPYFPPYGSDPQHEEECRIYRREASTQTDVLDQLASGEKPKKKKPAKKSRIELFGGHSADRPPSTQKTQASGSQGFQHFQTSKYLKSAISQGSGASSSMPYTPPVILPQRILFSPFDQPPLEHRSYGFKQLQPPKAQVASAAPVEAAKKSKKQTSSGKATVPEDRKRPSHIGAATTSVSTSSLKRTLPECARFRQFEGLRKSRNWFSFLSHPTRSEWLGQRSNGCGMMKNSAITAGERKRSATLKPVSAAAISDSGQYELLRQNPVLIRLGKSNIHGVGVFADDDISIGQFIVEYKGEIIRNVLVERREKFYRSNGLGSYMFQIDLACTIDGTMKGGLARFVNHSCDPNCTAKIIRTQDKKKHIILVAAKKISKGDELSYDYKLPKEKDKIPCLCASPICRKFLN